MEQYLKSAKQSLIAYIRNFGSNLWQEGYWDCMITYVERIGYTYASEWSNLFIEHKVLSESEVEMFAELEKVFLSIMEKRPGQWISISSKEHEEIERICQKILAHFDDSNSVSEERQTGG